jgi:hypothetical protein
MRIVRIILFALMCQALMPSCKKDDDKSNIDQFNLIGNWINPDYQDSLIILEKSNSLKINEYGISFKADSTLLERKNSGDCGTPPIVYADFEGSWMQQDSVIHINVGYWGGTAVYKWKVISVNDSKLIVKRVEMIFSGDQN